VWHRGQRRRRQCGGWAAALPAAGGAECIRAVVLPASQRGENGSHRSLSYRIPGSAFQVKARPVIAIAAERVASDDPEIVQAGGGSRSGAPTIPWPQVRSVANCSPTMEGWRHMARAAAPCPGCHLASGYLPSHSDGHEFILCLHLLRCCGSSAPLAACSRGSVIFMLLVLLLVLAG